MHSIYGPMFEDATLSGFLDDHATLQGILDFEAGLAHAEAKLGIFAPELAAAIAAACDADRFDLAAIGAATARAGSPVIPIIKTLSERVGGDAARYVHFGATTQDAIDTGLVLQLRRYVAEIERRLRATATSAARLARDHRDTVMAGRTWLQHALPITFGFKATGWLSMLDRLILRLAETRTRLLVLQFGGAVGTLASLRGKGLRVAEALGAELDLAVPDIPWHAQRDRIAELGCLLASIVAVLAKIARDIALMTQTELGEALEPAAPGRGGSSTMPHKRNPALSAIILAIAAETPQLSAGLLAAQSGEHERAAGGWQAEWRVLPELARLTGGALARADELLAGLELDKPRMRSNLDLTGGVLLAEAVMMELAPRLGRLAAHERLEMLCRRALAERRRLADLLAEDQEIGVLLDRSTIESLLDPASYLGVAREFVDRALDRHGRLVEKARDQTE
jgi:3-carboxy-cis,cis-muconate cycloisomerase